MKYPGRVIKAGEKDVEIVKALKVQLNNMLGAENSGSELHLNPSNGNYGPKVTQTVKLFQTRHVDSAGFPLKQDGEVGSLTWEALFGTQAVASAEAPADGLLAGVLSFAATQMHVRENPVNSNRGTEVDAYLKAAGCPLGVAWCCAFVFFCFKKAAESAGVANPMVRTGGCLDHWNRAESKGATRIPAAKAHAKPELVKPGMIFIADHGKGKGHTGLVESVQGGLIKTIEGNTDASQTREGGGVYRLTRKIVDINKGFIVYS